MQAKRQFHITAERRTFFDRKVLNYGSSRTVAMGKIIPKEWPYVRMTIIKQEPNMLTVTIEKLYLGVNHARGAKTDKAGRQDP